MAEKITKEELKEVVKDLQEKNEDFTINVKFNPGTKKNEK